MSLSTMSRCDQRATTARHAVVEQIQARPEGKCRNGQLGQKSSGSGDPCTTTYRCRIACVPTHIRWYFANRERVCVRTVSHGPRNLGQIPSLTGIPASTSLLREVVHGECVSACRCGLTRADGINCQACGMVRWIITRVSSARCESCDGHRGGWGLRATARSPVIEHHGPSD